MKTKCQRKFGFMINLCISNPNSSRKGVYLATQLRVTHTYPIHYLTGWRTTEVD